MGYWYCPNCKEEVSGRNVTYSELHDSCGHGVKWIEDERNMTFGEAVEAAKQGKRVSRDGWDNKGIFVYYQPGSSVDTANLKCAAVKEWAEQNLFGSLGIQGHLDMKAADNTLIVGWPASQTDILAGDWRVVE